MVKRLLFLTVPLAAFVLCVCGGASAQNSVEPSFTLKQVGPNVWAAMSNPKSSAPAGANTGFVIGDDAVAVIDTTVSADAELNFTTEPAQRLLAAIRSVTTLPVRFVINTHHHLDHAGANAVFVNAGAVVLAHHNVRDWLSSENVRLFGTEIKPGQKAFIEAMTPPTVTYEQGVDLYLGSRVIRVRSFPGHTGGDSVVLIPDAKVVFAGDLFWHDIAPTLIDASTGPLIETLSVLAKNEPGTTFVPGHGDVGNAQDVTAFRDYLTTLRTLISNAQARGLSGDALADAVMPVLSEKYSRWDAFTYVARTNILETDAELRGTKRTPQARSLK
jgi:cyclase